MRPLAFTLPYFAIFVAVFVWSMVAEAGVVRRATNEAAAGRTPQDRGSLRVVMITQFFAFFAAFSLAWLRVGRGEPRLMFWVGLVVLISGAVLRRLCFRALGQSFTGEVRVRPEQRVVTWGPYRWVRHPSYTAGMLMAVGVGLTLGTWLGALVALTLTLAGYLYRVRVEERALAETLGSSYVSYSARTKRFVPFVV